LAHIFDVSRYCYQKFVNFTNRDLIELVLRKEWHEIDAFQHLLVTSQCSMKTLIVPTLGEGKCRFKTVNLQQYSSLKSLGTFEHVQCEGVAYLFGTEPTDLNHKHAIGFLVSTWGKDPKVTSLQLTYTFAELCLAVFGLGFGSRGSVICAKPWHECVLQRIWEGNQGYLRKSSSRC
jgi:hypothetical protein